MKMEKRFVLTEMMIMILNMLSNILEMKYRISKSGL